MRVVSFPDEWGTAAPADQGSWSRGDMTIAGVLLRDGSNLFALIYPEGARFARAAPATEFSIEERFDGEPPSAETADEVAEVWREVIDMMIQAGHEVAAEMQAEGLGDHVPARYKP
jgi:hypothetical protein